MGINNSSKKTNLLKREGFYVVLFLCLCVVAVVTVYISKTNSLKQYRDVAKVPPVQVKENMQDAQQVKNNQNSAVPTMKNNSKEEDKKEQSKDTSAKRATKKVTIRLEAPIKGEVTKKFSKDDLLYTKSLDMWETHEAIDIACSLGSEVKVAAAGKVIDIYNDDKADKILKSGYGLTVVVEHNGYRTVYSNLADNLKIKKGDKLEAGATIGSIGDTSVREAVKVDGAHLHFALLEKKGNEYVTVDPTNFLKK
ncbi:MAG: M23 family metallopeptidase [Clostridium sp.]